MRVRTTLVLVVVFSALLFYVVRYELGKPSEVEIEAERRRLLDVDPAQVTYVKLESRGVVTELARDDTGRWHLYQPVRDRANDTAVLALLEELTPLSSVATLEGGRAERITYRLDRPTAVATIRRPSAAGHLERVLTVGRENPAFGAYYAIVDRDTTKLGLIDADLVEGYLMREASGYRNLRLADYAVEDPKTIVLTTPEGRIVLERELGTRTWTIVEPRHLPADQPVVNDLVRRFATQRIETFVDEDPEAPDLARYGLEPPAFRLTVVLENDLRTALDIGAPVPAGDGAVYARRVGRPTVFTLPEAGRLDLMRSLFELREKRIVGVSPGAVTGLRIEADGDMLATARDERGWVELNGDGARLQRVPVEQVIQNLTVLEARSFVDDPNAPAVRALESPLVRAALTTAAGDSVRVRFARTGGETYARVEPGGWVARVDNDDPDLLLGVLRTPPRER